MKAKSIICTIAIIVAGCTYARVQFPEPTGLPAESIPVPLTNEIRLQRAYDELSHIALETSEQQRRANREHKEYAIGLLHYIIAHPQEGTIQELNAAKIVLGNLFRDVTLNQLEQAGTLMEQVLESYEQNNQNVFAYMDILKVRCDLASIYLEGQIPEKLKKARALLEKIVKDVNYALTHEFKEALYFQAKIQLAYLYMEGMGGKVKVPQAMLYLSQVIKECKDSLDPALRQQANHARFMYAAKMQENSLEEQHALIKKYYEEILKEAAINPNFVLAETLHKTQEYLKLVKEFQETQESSPKKRRLSEQESA